MIDAIPQGRPGGSLRSLPSHFPSHQPFVRPYHHARRPVPPSRFLLAFRAVIERFKQARAAPQPRRRTTRPELCPPRAGRGASPASCHTVSPQPPEVCGGGRRCGWRFRPALGLPVCGGAALLGRSIIPSPPLPPPPCRLPPSSPPPLLRVACLAPPLGGRRGFAPTLLSRPQPHSCLRLRPDWRPFRSRLVCRSSLVSRSPSQH
jgi:hypothetical protein